MVSRLKSINCNRPAKFADALADARGMKVADLTGEREGFLMNTRRANGRLFGVLSVLSLLLGITFASSVTAQAQYPYGRDDQSNRDRDYRRDQDRDNDNDRDRDRRNRHRRRDDRDRNNGNYGNDGNYGNGGYNNGRYGNGGNGGYGNGGYGNYGYNVRQIAVDRGYQDGLNTGAGDAQRRQNYDPERSHYYRNATYGYSSSYGNREAYKSAYRDGFMRGYREGYSRYGGYGRGGYGGSRTGSILGGIFGRP
jgi:hypothetical protein